MAHAHNAIKAMKTLRITHVPEGRHRPRLMTLPQELRDIIWEYCLVEPALCDKRHNPDCDFYDTQAVNETPPIEFTDGRWKVEVEHRWGRNYRIPQWIHDERNVRCTELCVRRRGLALLQVSRQINEETAPIFWGRNTFCVRVCSGNVKHTHGITKQQGYVDALPKVQKLMIWYPQSREHPSWGSTREQDVLALVQTMSSLKRLELPCEFLRYTYDCRSVLSPPRLVQLRLWQFQQSSFDPGLGPGHVQELYTGVYHDFKWDECACGGHGPGGAPRALCVECIGRDRAVLAVARAMRDRWYIHRTNLHHVTYHLPWLEAAKAEWKRRHIQLSRREPGPHILKLKAEQNGLDEQVAIWGLPAYTIDERETLLPIARKKMAFTKMAAILKKPVKSIAENNDFGDDEPAATQGAMRERRPPQTQVADHEEMLRERAERNEQMEAYDKASEKRTRRKEARKRVGAEKVTAYMKQKARKRVQR